MRASLSGTDESARARAKPTVCDAKKPDLWIVSSEAVPDSGQVSAAVTIGETDGTPPSVQWRTHPERTFNNWAIRTFRRLRALMLTGGRRAAQKGLASRVRGPWGSL